MDPKQNSNSSSSERADEPIRRQALSLPGFLARSLTYFRRYWLTAAAIGALLLVQTAFRVLLPLGYQQIFDRAIAQRDLAFLELIVSVLLAAWGLQAIAALIQENLSARLGARALGDIRFEMFRHLHRLGVRFFHRADSGDLMSRFSTDLAAIEVAFVRGVPMFFYSAFILVVSVGLLFFVEWRLALVTFAVLPLTLIGSRLLAPRAQDASYERKRFDGKVAATVQEAIGAHAVVRVYDLRRARLALFRDQLEELRRKIVSAHFLAAVVGRAASQGMFVVQIVVLGVGAYLTVWDLLTVGDLVAFVTLLLNVGNAANFLSGVVPNLIQASGSMQRVRELLDEEPEITDAAGAVALPRLADALAFEDVSFGYGPDQRVLDRVSFRVAAGESVAIIGPSGSGKSTVLNLVLRLYDPDAGRVLIDGADLKGATESSLRAQSAVVLQQPSLFNATIEENIRIGKPGAGEEEIAAAARGAEIHDLVMRFPEGYRTVVGEGGGKLSGGQRQRIAIARAILRDPALLVLDEATSALDAVTESAIVATLRRLAHDRTVLATTHRLGTVADMDQILVVDQGRLVESGTHEELLERDGTYAELWRKQSGFTLTDDGRAEVTPERLRSIPLLTHLDDRRLEAVAQRLVTESYAGDRTVFEYGDPGDKFYLIVHGMVEVLLAAEVDAKSGARKLQDGDFFGELALLDDAPRSASIRTLAPTVFLTLGRQHFQELLADEPRLRAAVEQEARLRRELKVDDRSLATVAVKLRP